MAMQDKPATGAFSTSASGPTAAERAADAKDAREAREAAAGKASDKAADSKDPAADKAAEAKQADAALAQETEQRAEKAEQAEKEAEDLKAKQDGEQAEKAKEFPLEDMKARAQVGVPVQLGEEVFDPSKPAEPAPDSDATKAVKPGHWTPDEPAPGKTTPPPPPEPEQPAGETVKVEVTKA